MSELLYADVAFWDLFRFGVHGWIDLADLRLLCYGERGRLVESGRLDMVRSG